MATDDDPGKPRLLTFPTEPTPGFTPLAPLGDKGRYGLFPLGSGDVVVSLGVFNAIVAVLERGDSTGRAQMAAVLRRSYEAPFVSLPSPEEP